MAPCPEPLKPASGATLQVYLYYCSPGAGSAPLSYPPGDYIAEELCINAAKECGKCVRVCGRYVIVFT